MWPRVVEAMLGFWLTVSPFIFRHPADETALWWSDWITASLVILFGLLSYWRPTRHMHYATILVALWMFGYGWMQDRPVPPGWQNEMFVALILLMTAILPNQASLPPRPWREYYEGQGAEHG